LNTSTPTGTPPAQSYGAPGTPPAPQYGQPGPPQQQNPFGNAPVGENRTILGIIAIILGGLGIHKFLMGHTVPGVIMLLVSLVGGFFTCGMASIAMSVIGIIEGIMYLTKTDEQFRQEYVVGRKQWF
jgi:TM2 domain-containing membrane protein YozV